MAQDSTLIGTSIPGGYPAAKAALAPQMVRIYTASALAKQLRAEPTLPVAYSFKDPVDAQIEAVIKQLPKGSTITYWHEPEDDIASGVLRLADWVASTVALAGLVKKVGRVGEVRPAVILMSWTLVPKSGRRASDYYSPEVVAALRDAAGICGFDAYAGPQNGKGAADLYPPIAALARTLGLAWGVFETGHRIDANYDTVAQVGFWTEALDYAIQNGAHCFLLWNADPHNPDPAEPPFTYVIDSKPELVALWRRYATGSKPAPVPAAKPAPAPVATTPPPPATPVPTPAPAPDPRDATITELRNQLGQANVAIALLTAERNDARATAERAVRERDAAQADYQRAVDALTSLRQLGTQFLSHFRP